MAKRQKAWARRERARILRILGAICRGCGSTEKLEFDCADPVDEGHHGMDSSQRMSFYRKQFRVANLQVLCSRCNAWKGDMTFVEWRNALTAVSEGSRSNTIIKAGEQVQQPRLGLSPRENIELDRKSVV